MTASDVYRRLALSLAGQEKPHNAQVVVAYAKARDVEGLMEYLKYLTAESAL